MAVASDQAELGSGFAGAADLDGDRFRRQCPDSEGGFEAGEHLLAHLDPAFEDIAAALDAYRYEPIGTVYLAYPEPLRAPFPMLGMSGPLGQWVFDRGLLDGAHDPLLGVGSAFWGLLLGLLVLKIMRKRD